jgi:hypothetical protein
LLDIDRARSERYRIQISNGFLGIKPGWVRLSLPYYASEDDLDFILSAVEFVADHGLDFVPVYRLGWLDGVWRHIDRPVPECAPIKLSLDELTRASEGSEPGDAAPELSDSEIRAERARYFAEARRIAAELHARWQREPCRWNPSIAPDEINALCWFRFVHADNPWESRGQTAGAYCPAAAL